jgi:hypothetical protein
MTPSEIAAATAEQQREVLEALAAKIWGLTRPFEAVRPKPDIWVERWTKFSTMLDCGAYADAVLMLVPEGWMVVSWSELGLAGGCTAQLGNPGTGGEVTSDEGARTLALALAAAIAKAGEA